MADENKTEPEKGEKDETTTETTEPATGTETEETTPEGAEKPDAVKKALDAERNAAREARAQARDLQAKLDAAQATISALTGERDEAKTKLSDQETELSDLRPRVLQYEVASEVGIDLTLATRLRGDTREELVADAEDFIAKLGSGADFDTGPRRPAPKGETPEKAHAKLVGRLLRGEPIDEDD